MKKHSIYVLAAAAVLSAAGVAPAYAASLSCNSYGGKIMIIGGGSCGQTGNLLSNIQLPDCIKSNWPDYVLSGQPGIEIPDLGDSDIPDPGTQNPGTQNPGSSEDADIQEVLDLVNAERAKVGLSALSLHKNAVKAAQTRAKELQTSFSHTRPDGSSGVTALDQAGVSYRGFGENIAYGQKSAGEVMRQWMNSSGHRANILNGSFTSIGIGHYKSADGVDYWTQLFFY